MGTADPKSLAAASWFGYGRWDAPYWFVGKEPGGTDDPGQYASWDRLGRGELLDCREHDLDCPSARKPGMWHAGDRPPLQGTWRLLIAAVLAYEGLPTYDEEAVRRYQDLDWGRSAGKTAVLELSAVAARSVAQPEAMRLMHLDDRIQTFRARIAQHPPQFVVFYGAGTDPVHKVPYLNHWSEIAQCELVIDEPTIVGTTLFVAEKHPLAHGTTTEHWLALGRRMRAMRSHLPTL